MHILIIINTYGSYKEINKQYEYYNKSLVAQNEKFKEEMSFFFLFIKYFI